MRTRLVQYKDFIKSVVKKNTVLEKKFYFVVPFSPLEMGVSGLGSGTKKEYVIAIPKLFRYTCCNC